MICQFLCPMSKMGQDADWEWIAPAKYLGAKIVLVQHFFFAQSNTPNEALCWQMTMDLVQLIGKRMLWSVFVFFLGFQFQPNAILCNRVQFSIVIANWGIAFLAQTEPAPDRGISITRLKWRILLPPSALRNYSTDLQYKTAFNRPGKFVRWKSNVVNVKDVEIGNIPLRLAFTDFPRESGIPRIGVTDGVTG